MSDVRRIMKISGNVTRGLAVDFAEDSIYLKNKKSNRNGRLTKQTICTKTNSKIC